MLMLKLVAVSFCCVTAIGLSQARSLVEQAVDKTQESSEDDWEDNWEKMDAVPAVGPSAEQAKQKVIHCCPSVLFLITGILQLTVVA